MGFCHRPKWRVSRLLSAGRVLQTIPGNYSPIDKHVSITNTDRSLSLATMPRPGVHLKTNSRKQPRTQMRPIRRSWNWSLIWAIRFFRSERLRIYIGTLLSYHSLWTTTNHITPIAWNPSNLKDSIKFTSSAKLFASSKAIIFDCRLDVLPLTYSIRAWCAESFSTKTRHLEQTLTHPHRARDTIHVIEQLWLLCLPRPAAGRPSATRIVFILQNEIYAREMYTV